MQFDKRLNSCVACGSLEIFYWKSKYEANIGYNIFKCNKCSCGFMSPRPSDHELFKIYEKSGHGLEKPVHYDEIIRREEEFPNSTVDAERMVSYGHYLLSLSSDHTKPMKALDIGSGYGFYSLCAKKYGFDVLSINPGEYENSVCKEMFSRSGLTANIKVGMFQDFRFEQDEFALVILSQVLEHVKEPREMLKEICRILAPGGVLALAVPNFNSIFIKLMGVKDNSCLWVPEHLNYFTERALKFVIRGTNLKLEKCYPIARIPHYAISNRLRLKYGSRARRFLNNAVKIAQYLPCRIAEALEAGNYINAFYINAKTYL